MFSSLCLDRHRNCVRVNLWECFHANVCSWACALIHVHINVLGEKTGCICQTESKRKRGRRCEHVLAYLWSSQGYMPVPAHKNGACEDVCTCDVIQKFKWECKKWERKAQVVRMFYEQALNVMGPWMDMKRKEIQMKRKYRGGEWWKRTERSVRGKDSWRGK